MTAASTIRVVFLVIATSTAAIGQVTPGSAGDDVTLRQFQQRLDDYVALHHQLEGPLPPVHPTKETLRTYVARQLLANAIRKARPNARQGDFFTPEVASLFRARIRGVLAGRDAESVLAAAEPRHAESHGFQLLVNETYAADLPSALPAAVLQALPALADDIQYRMFNHDLILWDVHANLVIDVLPGAFTSPTTS